MYVCMYVYHCISYGFAPAAGPPCDCNLRWVKDLKICRVCNGSIDLTTQSADLQAPDNCGVDSRIRVTRWLFSVIWVSLGSIQVIKLSKDAHRGALQGPRIDFSWFLMDFGSPSGDHFGSLFHIICDLKCTKACLDCMHEFWLILVGKSCDFWWSNLSKV